MSPPTSMVRHARKGCDGVGSRMRWSVPAKREPRWGSAPAGKKSERAITDPEHARKEL